MAPLPEGCGEDYLTNQIHPKYMKARVRIGFPFDVQLLNITGKEPENQYSFYNPTIIASTEEKNRYFVAFREADFTLCHHKYRTTPPYHSRIHFGISDNPRGPVKYCSTFSGQGSRVNVPNGPEDPRFIYITPPGNNKTPILHMTYILYRTIHLAQVHFNITSQGCTAQMTNTLDMWASGTDKNSTQQNWMLIPDSTTSDGRPLFVYKLNPLEVIAINMETGEGNTVSSQPKLNCVPSLRGNTMFLHHPTKPNVFIGIAHETVGKRRNYYS